MGDKFNKNLKLARIQKGSSQKDVAEAIGVAKSTYSLYESGNRKPNIHTIKKLADYLNTSVDLLLGINKQSQAVTSHLDTNDLTSDELKDVANYIQFIKSKRDK
jgi:transcriptional regulator with XRE-family HTH domain